MEKEFDMLFPTCIIENNNLLYVTDYEHIFEKIDINSGNVKYIDNPKGYKPMDWSGTDIILQDTERFFLLEQSGERLMIYSPSDKNCKYLYIDCNDHVCINFAGATIYNENMYIFPRFRNSVLKIELKSGLIKKLGKLCSSLNYEFKEGPLPTMLFSCSYLIESHIWIFTEQNGIVIDYDLKQEKIKEYILPPNIKTCIHVGYLEGKFCILTAEGKIFLWTPYMDYGQELYDFGEKYSYPYFGTIANTKDRIWILPLFGNDIYFFDLVTRECKLYVDYPEDFKYIAPSDWSKYFFYSSDEKYFYFSMHSGNYIFYIDKYNGQEYWLKPIIDEEIRSKFYLENNRRYCEKSNCSIRGLMKALSEVSGEKELGDQNKIGDLIWDLVEGV